MGCKLWGLFVSKNKDPAQSDGSRETAAQEVKAPFFFSVCFLPNCNLLSFENWVILLFFFFIHRVIEFIGYSGHYSQSRSPRFRFVVESHGDFRLGPRQTKQSLLTLLLFRLLFFLVYFRECKVEQRRAKSPDFSPQYTQSHLWIGKLKLPKYWPNLENLDMGKWKTRHDVQKVSKGSTRDWKFSSHTFQLVSLKKWKAPFS